MSGDLKVISLRPKLGPDPYVKGVHIRPIKYELTHEDDLFWYGIPLNNLSVGERRIPKFVWKLCSEF